MSESIKTNIGEAVAPGGSPERVLGAIAAEAAKAESAE